MLPCDGCQPRPSVFGIDRHEIQLQGKVFGNVGAVSKNFTPRKPVNADALMMLVPASRYLVGTYPCTRSGA
jgi:hypothetical protein